MKLAMLITIGVGNTVSDGIAFSIRQNRPNYAVFLTTKASEEITLPKVLANVALPETAYEILRISDENDVQKCTLTFLSAIHGLLKKNYSPDEIAIDFTSGTKPMSAGLVAAAFEEGIGKLLYISGERAEEGRVRSGTEEPKLTIPRWLAARRLIVDAIVSFNLFRFDSCLFSLEKIAQQAGFQKLEACVSLLKDMAVGYRAWDRFEYQTAFQTLDHLSHHPLVVEWDQTAAQAGCRMIAHPGMAAWDFAYILKQHKSILHRIQNKPFCTERAIDLWHSAEKRAGENRFDDAMARLYRLVEYLAQLRLFAEHGGLETGNLNVSNLPEHLRAQYADRQGQKIELGLRKSFELLAQLGDPLGQGFNDRNTLWKDILQKRNESVLAHGFMPVSETRYQQARDAVFDLMHQALPAWEILSQKATFPVIDTDRVIENLAF